jgi:hypothetical protein
MNRHNKQLSSAQIHAYLPLPEEALGLGAYVRSASRWLLWSSSTQRQISLFFTSFHVAVNVILRTFGGNLVLFFPVALGEIPKCEVIVPVWCIIWISWRPVKINSLDFDEQHDWPLKCYRTLYYGRTDEIWELQKATIIQVLTENFW